MEDMKNKEKVPYRFKVSGNIIKKLGEESITNKNIAVLELIKNSYDAGAKKVEIQLKYEEIPEYASIWISDDGEGMSSSDIENKWMNIATTSKKGSIINKKTKRILVGEKGIGRLSTESLGRITKLITKPINDTKGTEIIFEWDKYQKENILVGEIINEGYSFTKKRKEHGTELEISKLRHDWNEIQTQESLLKDIYLLNPPNKPLKEWKVVPKFHTPKMDFKKIRRGFINNASYSLKTRLSRYNLIRYDFFTKKGKKVSGTHQLDRKLKCGDSVFELFFYYRSNKYLKRAQGIELSSQELKEVISVLNEYKGIKLYRDNFRVKPYGDPENDWIGLEIAAQNNTMCPRNHQIFGMVHISKSKNPKIIDTTTREGVLSTDEFNDLRYFVQISILKVFMDLRSMEESDKKKARKSTDLKIKKGKIKEAFPSPTREFQIKEERIVDIKGDYPDIFYIKLEDEINGCYNMGFPNATFFLCRKIIENLIYDVLQKQFPKNSNVWWEKNDKISQPKSLSGLITSLHENRSNFGGLNIKKYIVDMQPRLKKIRDKANPLTHNNYDYFNKKEELDEFRVNDVVQMLVKIYNLI